MFELLKKLFPICRSITGNGVRKTLSIIKEIIPINMHEIPSGTKVFDWTIPKEWNIYDAYIKDEKGQRIIDFKKSNLHVVNYSSPISGEFSLSELKKNIYTIPKQPDLIPYITSYYKERWGFCMSQKQLDALKEANYKVKIDSKLERGFYLMLT